MTKQIWKSRLLSSQFQEMNLSKGCLTRCAAATNEITNGTSNATTTTSNSKMTSRSTPTTAQSSPKGMHQRGKKIALLASKPLQKNTANFFQFEILVLFDTLCTIVHYSCATNYSTMQNTSMIFNYRSRILIFSQDSVCCLENLNFEALLHNFKVVEKRHQKRLFVQMKDPWKDLILKLHLYLVMKGFFSYKCCNLWRDWLDKSLFNVFFNLALSRWSRCMIQLAL